MRTGIAYYRKTLVPQWTDEQENMNYLKEVVNGYAEQNGILVVREYSNFFDSPKNIYPPKLDLLPEIMKRREYKVDDLLISSVDHFGYEFWQKKVLFLEVIQNINRVIFVAENLSLKPRSLISLFRTPIYSLYNN